MDDKFLNKNNSTIKYIGLNNSECINPVYYCQSKKVFLSADDVEKKKCLCKPTSDMISTKTCQWLMTVDEFIKYEENRRKTTSAYDREYRARKRGKNG